MADQSVVIGVDIGGTKIKVGAIEVEPDGAGRRVIASQQLATPRTPPISFYETVADAVRQVRTQAEQAGRAVLPLAAVTHPGRFLPDGTLARGTAPNMGPAPGAFDGVSPAGELERRLPGSRIVAENDAISQMRFGLDLLLRDPSTRPSLLNETVIYLGPGTGMGGGVARIDKTGAVTPITDGHFFDLQLPDYGDGTLTAEEIYTGPAIARIVTEANRRLTPPIEPARAGGLDEILKAPDARPEHRAEAERIADGAGEILAEIIATIHAGRIVKVRLEHAADGRIATRHVDEPDRAWSARDQAAVRGTRRFILGGFLGCSEGFGSRMRRRALETLRGRGLTDVQVLQIPFDSADAGLLGSVLAIPEEALRLASKKGSDPFSAKGV